MFLAEIKFLKSLFSYIRSVILLLDNYDSFTYNLKDYFEQLGQEIVVARNDELSIVEVANLDVDALVISPGPGRPQEAGICMELLTKCSGKIPVLGICLGMQAIGLHWGAKLNRAAYPMHGKLSLIDVSEHALFENLPQQFQVCRYHSLVLSGIEQTKMKVLATTEIGEIMAIEHSRAQMVGMQFHPEAILTQFGLQMLSNWLKHINLQPKKSNH